MEPLFQSLKQLDDAIRLCLEKQLRMPAVALVYSGIDGASWLHEGDNDRPVRDRFTRWVERYMEPETRLGCTAMDLYAARCGLLHTFTGQSHLSRAGKARMVVYASGKDEAEDLTEFIQLGRLSDCVAVKTEDLVEAYRRGLGLCLKELTADPEKAKALNEKATHFYTEMSSEERDRLVDWGKRILGEV